VAQILISAQNLNVAYEQHVALAIPDLSLSGKIVAVLGHNGAGKSTFIKTVLGLLSPRSGTLEINSISDGKKLALLAQEHMAFCPENGSVFADISVESYIKMWCRFKHGDPNYYRGLGARYIEMLSIAPLLKKLGRTLSKGQRRRVQTFVGFLLDPKLFLFDEPFDGLDVQRTRELAEIISLESDLRAFILSSHRMDVVERLADYLVILQNGCVAAHGTVTQVSAALCYKSVLISVGQDSASIYETLRIQFQSCVVNRIGDQVTVSGADCDATAIIELLKKELPTATPRIEAIQPSLVDAMTYHLRVAEGG